MGKTWLAWAGAIAACGVVAIASHWNEPAKTRVNAQEPAATPPAPTFDLGDAKKEYMHNVTELMAYLAICRNQKAGVQNALATGNRYGIYDAAKSAFSMCDGAEHRIEAIPFHANYPNDVADRLESAFRDCSLAAFSRKKAYESVQSMADQGPGPAQVSAMREHFESGDSEESDCVEAIGKVARDSGLLPHDPPAPGPIPVAPDAIEREVPRAQRPKITPQVRAMMADYPAAIKECQQSAAACQHREDLDERLMAAGMCEGEDASLTSPTAWAPKSHTGECHRE